MRVGERARPHCGVLIADVNNLRRINDSLGHAAGDSAIREVGRYPLDADSLDVVLAAAVRHLY